MLSYQHHYHVGNHADVLKHWTLFTCVDYMQNKAKPFDYIDTHAGAGLYELQDVKTQKLKEFEGGIQKLLAQPFDEVQAFLAQIRPFTDNHQYPGSPALVQHMMQPQNKSWLFELHPQTFQELRQHCAKNRRHFVRQEDGFQQLKALLPVASRRALVLIDPSYELKEDYLKVVQAMETAIKQMPQTTVLIWYPIVQRENVNSLEKALCDSSVRNVLKLELSVSADSEQKGMTGSGMMIANPPWTLQQQAEKTLPQMASVLAGVAANTQVEQLIPE